MEGRRRGRPHRRPLAAANGTLPKTWVRLPQKMASPLIHPHQVRVWLMALAAIFAMSRGRQRRNSGRGAVATAAAAAAAVLRHAADVCALGLGFGEATAAFQRARALEVMRKSTAVVL